MVLSDDYIFDLDENVTRTPVTYKTRYGIPIAADLYRPKDFERSREYPAVLVGAPYGGVKEQGPGIYAQNMALRGFVALTFDPSYNGYSGGEPRHLSSPDLFVEDFHAAVDYLGTRPFVDRGRIGGIGICGSGAFLLAAAQVDRRIKAVATTSMVDIARAAQQGPTGSLTDQERDAVLDEIAEQRYAEFEGGRPVMTPRGAPLDLENADATGCEFGKFYSRPRGYHPNSITQFTVTSGMSWMNFSLLTRLESISPRPILLVVGENAISRFFSEDAYANAAEPKELHVVPGADHVDLYDKTDLIPFDKLEEFFTKNLT